MKRDILKYGEKLNKQKIYFRIELYFFDTSDTHACYILINIQEYKYILYIYVCMFIKKKLKCKKIIYS